MVAAIAGVAEVASCAGALDVLWVACVSSATDAAAVTGAFAADAATTAGAVPGTSAVTLSSVDAAGSADGLVEASFTGLLLESIVLMSVLMTALAALILPGMALGARGAVAASATVRVTAAEGVGALTTAGGGVGPNAMLRVEKGRVSTRADCCVACKELVVPASTSRCATTTPAVSRPSIWVGIPVDFIGACAGVIRENFASFAS